MPLSGGGATAEVKHTAVIAGEEDEGVVGDSLRLERLHHFADHPVELVDEVAVDAALAGALESRRRGEWVMDGGGGEEAEEGLVAALFDPAGGLFGQLGADLVVVEKLVGLDSSAERVGATLCFLGFDRGDGRDVLGTTSGVHERIIGVTADDLVVLDVDVGRRAVHHRHAEVVVEAEILRARAEWLLPIVFALFEAEVPFAEDGRGVTSLFEDVGDGLRFRRDEQWRGDGCRPPDV